MPIPAVGEQGRNLAIAGTSNLCYDVARHDMKMRQRIRRLAGCAFATDSNTPGTRANT